MCGGVWTIMFGTPSKKEVGAEVDPVQLSIFSNLFMSVAEQMGRTLQRTAISTNIKERLDFSCAIFDEAGGLVANAPHVPVLRPLNYPPETPGRGAPDDSGSVAVINLIGRVWVGEFDSPFAVVDDLLAGGFGQGKPVVVDFHAEATSEKAALAWHLDGRVAAVVGAHTHVPTADCKVLPGGTGFVSDLGMVGAVDSILGVETEGSLNRFLSGYRHRMKPVRTGLMNFNSVLIDVDDSTGLATSVERVDRQIEV